MPVVNLSIETWNNILTLLAEQPFKVAAPLINQVSMQLQAQVDQPQNMPRQENRPNGQSDFRPMEE